MTVIFWYFVIGVVIVAIDHTIDVTVDPLSNRNVTPISLLTLIVLWPLIILSWIERMVK